MNASEITERFVGKKHSEKIMNCSFCGKSEGEVEKLIAGPAVYICNKCVGTCVEIINHNKNLKKRKM